MHLSKPSTVVVAVGGNALLLPEQKGTIYEEFANTRRLLSGLYPLFEQGHRVVLTHGNGPQVGTMLIRVEVAEPQVPGHPLGVIVADTEGSMGYMIAQSLYNGLVKRGLRREVVTVLTQVVVDRDDPSIAHPTKPIGPFYTAEQAAERRTRGWTVVEDSGRGWRRVVPSPAPLRIVEVDTIRLLVEAGTIVIAAGGGGIPVYVEPDGTLEGVDAVIDKDLASLVLAREIGAEVLITLTAVPAVYADFGRPTQRVLRRLPASEAEALLAAGQFPPGSMGPKIKGAIQFIRQGGRAAIITDADHAAAAMAGTDGTTIVPD